ncbi:hypothetical protein CVT25_010285 [Psilocybe cyanescens]|uniref:Uncharacterized protein n=1 Tax=Psilocybe cyanescens TaxID=93625 RepID=A0A409X2S3_PSICY|nr:hypothetical protein CVT25_010285 [Psilocybe cyanescens]
MSKSRGRTLGEGRVLPDNAAAGRADGEGGDRTGDINVDDDGIRAFARVRLGAGVGERGDVGKGKCKDEDTMNRDEASSIRGATGTGSAVVTREKLELKLEIAQDMALAREQNQLPHFAAYAEHPSRTAIAPLHLDLANLHHPHRRQTPLHLYVRIDDCRPDLRHLGSLDSDLDPVPHSAIDAGTPPTTSITSTSILLQPLRITNKHCDYTRKHKGRRELHRHLAVCITIFIVVVH